MSVVVRRRQVSPHKTYRTADKFYKELRGSFTSRMGSRGVKSVLTVAEQPLIESLSAEEAVELQSFGDINMRRLFRDGGGL